ncbi:MAG TPA: glutamate ABC transporter substrate-binding protein [Microlunatus sp.]
MRIKKRIAAVGAASVLAIALAACASDDSGTGSDNASGGGDNAVTIGIKFDQPNVGMKVGSDYQGFDVDVARYVANELGYNNITFKEAKSADRETLIQSGQVKMVFASYTINEERQQKVSFGGPYLMAGQDLLVRSDDSSITGPDSLNGKKLCSVTGSTSAQNVKKEFANKVQLQEFDSYSKCLPALLSGNIDALTTDDDILAGYAAQPQYKGKLKLVGQPFTEEPYGVGIKKGDTALCKKIDTALTKMVDSGEWQKALDKNFGDAGYKPDASKNPPKQIPCT